MIDLALERGLPSAPDCEKLALGSVLADESSFQAVCGALEEQDFSLEGHRRIFQRIAELHKRGERIDRVTVANELLKFGQLESVGGVSYLCSLDEGLPAISNLDGYVRIIQDKATLRRMIFACQGMIDRCIQEQDSPGNLLADNERVMRELGAKTATKGNLTSMADVLSELDINAIGGSPANVVRTPYGALNRSIVGFGEGELVVIGARPSAGKSTMVLEMALGAAEAGWNVALFSLEMKKQAILLRGACNRGEVDNAALRHGRLTFEERMKITGAMTNIAKLPLYIDDKAQTFPAMAREVRRMPHKPRVLIIDHLHLMRGGGRTENRNNELAGITRDLKLFAGELGCTVILLAQLNRTSPKEKRPPEMHDLRESGSIEADADIILLLHKLEEHETEAAKGHPVPVDMRLAKQREGVAFLKIPMLLAGKFYKFYEQKEAA